MKILNLSDSHIAGVNSINRTGDYYKDVMLKLDETIELSKKCDLVIHSGDVFHTNTVANSIVDDFLDKIESAKIPWYILPGNHDELGAKWETSGGTSLAHIFRRSKIVQQLTELEIDNLYIKGYPYYHGVEQDIKDKGLIGGSIYKQRLAVTHAFISPKKFRDDVLHVEIVDINTNYDIILCSHFHEDWGAIKNNSTTYINVGAWGRRTIGEAKHHPKVTIINVGKNKMDYEFIKLKSAKPGKEVFNLAAKEELKNNEAEMQAFIDSLKDFQTQDADLRGNIEYIGNKNNVERPVIDRILEKLREVEK